MSRKAGGMASGKATAARLAGGRLSYRGVDALDLARTRSLEEVAALLWTGAFETDLFDTPLHVIGGAAAQNLPILSRMQSVLPLVAAKDALAADLSPRGAAQTGWRVLNLLTSVAAESKELEPTIEETLARTWAPGSRKAASLIRAALILCADRPPDEPAAAARSVASARANPYAVVLAGLAALEGPDHAGRVLRVESLFDDLRSARNAQKVLEGRPGHGGAIDGFGHPSWPGGDANAAALLAMLPGRKPMPVVAAAEELTGEKPALEFALVALSRALEFPAGASVALLALSRSIGWIGHAIEQYAQPG